MYRVTLYQKQSDGSRHIYYCLYWYEPPTWHNLKDTIKLLDEKITQDASALDLYIGGMETELELVPNV